MNSIDWKLLGSIVADMISFVFLFVFLPMTVVLGGGAFFGAAGAGVGLGLVFLATLGWSVRERYLLAKKFGRSA